MRRLIQCTLHVTAVVLLFSYAQSSAFQAYTHTDLTDKVDALFSEWDKEDSPGAAIGIIKDGRIIYARGYGMANLEYAIPNSPQTVFRIGSTSKHFTAMCIALLGEMGKLSFDDNIRQYIPELPDYGTPITIRHMLHHTSGFRNYEALMELAGRDGSTAAVPFYTDPEAVALIALQKNLNFVPGERYSYSNSNFFLLAEVIGRVSGMTTATFAKTYIFDPLSMENTHFHDDRNMIVKNRASGYSPKEGGGFRINMTQLEQLGTGSIYTTIEDFFKWDQNFYNNKLGKGIPRLITWMETPGQLNNGESANYGFGLNVNTFYGLRQIGHGGSFVGFRSFYMRFPDQRFSVVILANQGPYPSGDLARKIAILYLGDLLTEKPDTESTNARRGSRDEEREPIQLSSGQLDRLTGSYYCDELDVTYTVTQKDNQLTLRIGRYHEVLTATTPHVLNWGYSTFTFSNNDGRAAGFTLASYDIQNLYFKRIE